MLVNPACINPDTYFWAYDNILKTCVKVLICGEDVPSANNFPEEKDCTTLCVKGKNH